MWGIDKFVELLFFNFLPHVCHEAGGELERLQQGSSFGGLDAVIRQTIHDLIDGDQDGVFGVERRKFEGIVLDRPLTFDDLPG